ncbi:hypothetical protein PACTADRAFT_50431 [Pachysolen tannophilus NRRL Y-2460]|uniref:Mediator of RNA polymerase II transcription subunit 6 n=1 Tax=Pachysolen tannophilus NRRL Y-2460 TaxID=669874 RepID=A0A1E4TS13_PACTA|nr:hypothetical protein PACTADRAFT_50431 [Pachysolen tannophilus NRRL Y-2460]
MSQEGPVLSELQWKSPEWIQAFGLRTDNVLEYFSQSPFFDRTSNNQVLKMQSQFQLTPTNIQQELVKMKGIEFVVAHVREPDFWVIRKQKRESPENVTPINDYYIIGANIYMAPTIASIVESRLLSTVLSLRESLIKLNKLPKFTPSTGHFYNFDTSTNGGTTNSLNNNKNELGSTSSRLKPKVKNSTTPGNTAISTTTQTNTSVSSSTFDALLNVTIKQQNR